MPEINANYTFTRDQEQLINMYIAQYNQTNSHIEQLLDMLDEIRLSIFNLVNTSRRNRNRQGTSSTYINSFINQLFNDRENNYIRYDYNTPINPNLYTVFNDANPRTSTRRNTNTNVNSRNNELTNFINTFLNTPVIIRPTQEQIQSASRLVRFQDIESPLSDRCPISLEVFSRDEMVRQLVPCGHIFCQTEFQQWFENNVRCPVCRYDIRNYRSNTDTTVNTNDNVNAYINTDTSVNNANANTNANANANTNVNTNINANADTNVNSNTNAEVNPNNLNIVRNTDSNEIEHITFDITNNQMSNNIVDGLTNRILESILFPQLNNNDRFAFDASNNILLYETIIRPNSNR
jgi:hypothetical protein